jgi:hypothetical protein
LGQQGKRHAFIHAFRAASRAAQPPDAPMHFEHCPAACPLVQSIHILCDQSEPAGKLLLKFSQRPMPRIRLRSGNQPTPPRIPLPNGLRITRKRVRRRQFLRAKLPPQSRCSPKRRYPALRRNPRSGQDRYCRSLCYPSPRLLNAHFLYAHLFPASGIAQRVSRRQKRKPFHSPS